MTRQYLRQGVLLRVLLRPFPDWFQESYFYSLIDKRVPSSDHHDILKKVSVTIPILCSKFVSDTIFDTFFKKVYETIPILFRYSSCKKCCRLAPKTTKMRPKIIWTVIYCLCFNDKSCHWVELLSCAHPRRVVYVTDIHTTGLKVSERDWNLDFFPIRYRYFEIFPILSSILKKKYPTNTFSIRYRYDTAGHWYLVTKQSNTQKLHMFFTTVVIFQNLKL